MGGQIEQNEMPWACSTYGGEERCIQVFCGETDHFEDPDIDGKKIVRWIFRQWGRGIELAQDRDRWQVNTITC